MIIRTIVLPRLNLNYCKTRSSTVGISQIGLVLTTLGGLATFFRNQYKFRKEEGPKDASMQFVTLGFTGLVVYTSAITLASALRLERIARYPYFRRREPSRLERTSLRAELEGRRVVLVSRP